MGTKLYDILGVKPDVSKSDLKKSYRKLAKEFHPDSDTGDEDKFKILNEAYEILSNPEMRKKYDDGFEISELKEEANGLVRRAFSVFQEAMNDHGFVPAHSDLFKIMKECVNHKEIRMKGEVEILEGEIKNTNEIQSRLINAEIFVSFLEEGKKDKEDRIKELETEMQYLTQILGFIRNCEYLHEEDIEPKRREYTSGE